MLVLPHDAAASAHWHAKTRQALRRRPRTLCDFHRGARSGFHGASVGLWVRTGLSAIRCLREHSQGNEAVHGIAFRRGIRCGRGIQLRRRRGWRLRRFEPGRGRKRRSTPAGTRGRQARRPTSAGRPMRRSTTCCYRPRCAKRSSTWTCRSRTSPPRTSTVFRRRTTIACGPRWRFESHSCGRD